ncbi:MAG: hypothetical protein QXN68_06430 [Thermoplasmata archaeon]
MSEVLFEAEIYISLYQNYLTLRKYATYPYQQFEVKNISYPPLFMPYNVLQKVLVKPIGVVFPFENEIICIPNKINFGLVFVTQTKKVRIWNTSKSNSIKVNQIQTTDRNVSINLTENEKINPNHWVEKEVTAYPRGKTLMVNDFFQILWDIT